jgi:hypothetical protein
MLASLEGNFALEWNKLLHGIWQTKGRYLVWKLFNENFIFIVFSVLRSQRCGSTCWGGDTARLHLNPHPLRQASQFLVLN